MPDVDKIPDDVEIFVFARPYYSQVANPINGIDLQGTTRWTNCKGRAIGAIWKPVVGEDAGKR